MAKVGEFIGQVEESVTKEDAMVIKKLIADAFKNNYFGEVKVSVKKSKQKTALFCEEHTYNDYTIIVTLPKECICHKGDGDVVRFNEVSFWITKDSGYLEYQKCVKEKDFNYNERNFDMQCYNINAMTNGKYHRYRCHHKHDFVYEGRGSFMYDTEVKELKDDICTYVRNIWFGCL